MTSGYEQMLISSSAPLRACVTPPRIRLDRDFMSDPRNVAHAKKVTQEKKHQGTEARPDDTPAAQPGKKAAVAKKKRGRAEAAAVPTDPAASEGSVSSETPAAKPSAALEGSLVVLGNLKELEFHSRANLERARGAGVNAGAFPWLPMGDCSEVI